MPTLALDTRPRKDGGHCPVVSYNLIRRVIDGVVGRDFASWCEEYVTTRTAER